MKSLAVLGTMIVFLSGCAALEPANDGMEQASEPGAKGESMTQTPSVTEEVIADNLDAPWSIIKHGSVYYVSERGGTIAKIENGEVERQTVAFDETVSDVSEGGFLGLVLSPDFDESNEAYGYYTYTSGNAGMMNRIVKLEQNGTSWEETDVLVDNIPGAATHNGGRLAFGPDDKLYATTGDASEPEFAQEEESLGGKILRLEPDGAIPEDNPEANSYVYSYGHRNVQGLAWDEAGNLYASEHGASQNDEINQIEAGNNYGWPEIEGNEEQAGMESPLFTSGTTTTWAPSGMGYHEGNLYVGMLRGTGILSFDLANDQQENYLSGNDRVRDILIDGNMLYYITNNTDGRGNPQAEDDHLVRRSLSEE